MLVPVFATENPGKGKKQERRKEKMTGTTFISIISIWFGIPIVIHNLLSGKIFIAFIFMILVVINIILNLRKG